MRRAARSASSRSHPSFPNALESIGVLLEAGVVVSIGHTAADYDQAKRAFDVGARILTHTFNAMNGIHHRDPGPIIAAFEDESITLELILDGLHVHPRVADLVFTAAPGRVALITDAMAAAGAADGNYRLGSLNVTVNHGLAVLSGTSTIAGSTLTLDVALRNAVTLVGLDPRIAVEALTLTPARALGLEHRFGRLHTGYAADAVLLDHDWTVAPRLGRRPPPLTTPFAEHRKSTSNSIFSEPFPVLATDARVRGAARRVCSARRSGSSRGCADRSPRPRRPARWRAGAAGWPSPGCWSRRGPSTAPATASALPAPKASRMRCRARRIVPRPCVMQCTGTSVLGREEPRVVAPRLLGERLHAGQRRERRPRLVETEVAVGADPEDLHVDTARGDDRALVVRAGVLDPVERPVRDVDARRVETERLDHLAGDHRTIALGMPCREPDVLVECEPADLRDVDSFRSDLRGERAVQRRAGSTRSRGRARRQESTG